MRLAAAEPRDVERFFALGWGIAAAPQHHEQDEHGADQQQGEHASDIAQLGAAVCQTPTDPCRDVQG